MRKLPLYLPDYGSFVDLDLHRRHVMTGERARSEGIACLMGAEPAAMEDLLAVHAPGYVEALRTGHPEALASSGGAWSPGAVALALSVLGAFRAAIDHALCEGISGMLGGGGHHAYPDHGGALSFINEIALGIRHLRRRGIQRVMVLDLDAHFGNGTVACFPDDKDLFLLDYHGRASDFGHPGTPHRFRSFHLDPDARGYLAMLRRDLPDVLDAFQPEACLYLAGMDVFSGTPNPPLRLRRPDIERREDCVFRELSQRRIPVTYVHAGGYASLETLVDLHGITARAAHRALIESD